MQDERKKYSELLKQTGDRAKISYHDLLNTFEWEEKRNVILARDNYQCRKCNTEVNYREYNSDTKTYWYLAFKITEDPYKLEEFYRDDRKKRAEFAALSDEEKEKKRSFPLFTEGGNRWIITEHFGTDRPIYLHVHHLYYVLSRLPWEYPNEALKTFCNWCHWDFHKHNKVIAFKNEDEPRHINLTPCHRCNGAGIFPEFSHIQAGICFRCNGKMFEELILS